MNTVGVAISCVCNALLFGKRYEMLSSRSYRCNWFVMVIVLDTILGKGHCQQCYQFEVDHFDGIQD